MVNKYHLQEGQISDNYFDCSRSSSLGNPYPAKTGKDRDEACDKYESWFSNSVSFEELKSLKTYKKFVPSNPQTGMIFQIYRRLEVEREVFLMCTCKPKRCHCDTIKSFLEESYSKLKEG